MNNDRRAALCRVYVSSVFVHEATVFLSKLRGAKADPDHLGDLGDMFGSGAGKHAPLQGRSNFADFRRNRKQQTLI